jgi:enoyl-CoA hydratase/carnithine racemase
MQLPKLERLLLSAADGVLTVTIENPPLNHFGVELARSIIRLCAWLERRTDLQVVVFQSDIPGFFIPHVDLKDLGNLPTPPAPIREIGFGVMSLLACCGTLGRLWNRWALQLLSPFHTALDSVWRLPQTTIAVVEGRIGGLGSEFAMCMDMRFADKGQAVLNQLECACGLFPGAGGTQRLPLLIGRGRSSETIMSSRDLDAETAERWGYYNRALSRGEVRPFVTDLARRIANFPVTGVRESKRFLRLAQPLSEKTLQLEAIAFMKGMFSRPTRDRIAAFLNAGGQEREGAERIEELLLQVNPKVPHKGSN